MDDFQMMRYRWIELLSIRLTPRHVQLIKYFLMQLRCYGNYQYHYEQIKKGKIMAWPHYDPHPQLYI